jgi:hypothetical protein
LGTRALERENAKGAQEDELGYKYSIPVVLDLANPGDFALSLPLYSTFDAQSLDPLKK